MSFAFVSHVPFWVWLLLTALIAQGLSATRTRQIPLSKALAVPVVMSGLSVYGVVSGFATSVPALIAWVSAVVIALALRAAMGWWGRVSWIPATRRVQVPGSWLPLVYMLGIFALKFSVAAALVTRPELKTHGDFATWICLAYGAFTGIFLGRVVSIRRAMRAAGNAQASNAASLTS